MTLSGRRLRKYHPRRSKYLVRTQKQQLADLEKKISMVVGALVVMSETGNAEKVHELSQKIRVDILKYGSEMEKLASQMRGSYPKIVHEFLLSAERLAKCAPGWLDLDKVKHCYAIRDRLQQMTRAA